MQINNLSLSFGVQKIFEEVNLVIPENEKVGIVGANGAGKTTFFKLILGILNPDEGNIRINNNFRIGFLPQVIDEDLSIKNETVLEYLLSARPIEKLNNELQKTYEKIANEKSEENQRKLFTKVDKLQSKLDYWGVYSYSSDLLKITNGMLIDDEILNKKLTQLSGGQKSKVAFARLLYSKAEILLLDEPTNHLDKETRDFILEYLKKYNGSVYVISHDIDFLNEITTKILHIDKRTKKISLYNGNYSNYIKVSDAKNKALESEVKNQNKEIERLQAIVDKYHSSSGKRKKMAQDREKKLKKLLNNKVELAPTNKKTKFSIEINRESESQPLKVIDLNFKYDKSSESNIINHLTFSLNKSEKFLIVGSNGVGKSTLLKLIVGQLLPDSGNIEIGKKTDIGYYAQEHELLNNNETILDNFSDIDITLKKLRSYLGRFLFYGDDVYKKVGVLSPGERSRVALAKLSLTGANLLILDEPTNHLDPETQKIIANTFKDFPGTMLVVSHNPDFVDNLGIERTLRLPEGKIDYYNKELVDYYHELNNINPKKVKKR